MFGWKKKTKWDGPEWIMYMYISKNHLMQYVTISMLEVLNNVTKYLCLKCFKTIQQNDRRNNITENWSKHFIHSYGNAIKWALPSWIIKWNWNEVLNSFKSEHFPKHKPMKLLKLISEFTASRISLVQPCYCLP